MLLLSSAPSAAGGGELTGGFSGSAVVDVHDSVILATSDLSSEPGCISSLSTGGEEAKCTAEMEGRVRETGRRSPESPADPTPKLRPDLVIIRCLTVSSVSSLILEGLIMSPLGDIYSFASWQNRHFGGVFRP